MKKLNDDFINKNKLYSQVDKYIDQSSNNIVNAVDYSVRSLLKTNKNKK